MRLKKFSHFVITYRTIQTLMLVEECHESAIKHFRTTLPGDGQTPEIYTDYPVPGHQDTVDCAGEGGGRVFRAMGGRQECGQVAGEREAGLRPGICARSKPLSLIACTGPEMLGWCRSIWASVALPVVKGKISSCPRVAQQEPTLSLDTMQEFWHACSRTN